MKEAHGSKTKAAVRKLCRRGGNESCLAPVWKAQLALTESVCDHIGTSWLRGNLIGFGKIWEKTDVAGLAVLLQRDCHSVISRWCVSHPQKPN